MKRQEAIDLLQELIRAEVEVVKKVNNGDRGLTGATRREHKAITAIFLALTGDKKPPTLEEFEQISE